MPFAGRAKITRWGAIVAAMGLYAIPASTQGDIKPVNDAPNPFQSIENYFKLPEGRTWGSTSAVEIDKDGKSIWWASAAVPTRVSIGRRDRCPPCHRC